MTRDLTYYDGDLDTLAEDERMTPRSAGRRRAADAASAEGGGGMSAFMITEPGIYPDLDDATYHGDPIAGGSLSSTGARILAKPGGQAKYRAYLDLPRATKKAWDVGHLVHTEVLGTGPGVVEIPDELLAANGAISTTAAKAFVEEARESGLVPMKRAELVPVRGMVAAILAHPIAARLLAQPGTPEASGFAQDPETGVWVRVRPDYLPHRREGRTVMVDLKTTRSADPGAFGRTAAEFGYHQQDPWYQDGVRWARGDDDTAFVFLLVEKEAPYLTSIVELDDEARRMGRERNRLALDRFAISARTGEWPGYDADITTASLPRWAEFQHDEEMSAA